MNPTPKLLISLGLFLIAVGIYLQYGSKVLPLGRLPGDIAIERENFRFYFPITTCLLISLALQLLFKLSQYFKR